MPAVTATDRWFTEGNDARTTFAVSLVMWNSPQLSADMLAGPPMTSRLASS